MLLERRLMVAEPNSKVVGHKTKEMLCTAGATSEPVCSSLRLTPWTALVIIWPKFNKEKTDKSSSHLNLIKTFQPQKNKPKLGNPLLSFQMKSRQGGKGKVGQNERGGKQQGNSETGWHVGEREKYPGPLCNCWQETQLPLAVTS